MLLVLEHNNDVLGVVGGESPLVTGEDLPKRLRLLEVLGLRG